MKTLNVRELRSGIPTLRELLAVEREVVLTSNGEPIARLLPIEPTPKTSRLPSLKAFRATLPPMDPPLSALVREQRDRRGG